MPAPSHEAVPGWCKARAEPRCLLPSCSSSRTPRSPRHADPCETHPNPTTSMCCADGNRRALLSAGWEGFSAPRLLLAYHFCEMIHLPHTEVTKTRRSYTGDNPVPMKGEGCLRPCGTPLPAKPPPPRASPAPSAQHFYEKQTGSILMGRKCPPPARGANL